MVLKTLIVIYSRFYGRRMTDKESISYLYTRHKIIIVGIRMNQFHSCSEIKSVLYNIISATYTYRCIIRNIIMTIMLIRTLGKKHQIIHTHITGLRLNAQVQIVTTAVIQIQSRE